VQVNGAVALARCATPDVKLSKRENRIMRHKVAAVQKTIGRAPTTTVTIQVSFQIISDGATGNIPDQYITAQLATLNAAYAPYGFHFVARLTVRIDNAGLHASCASASQSFKNGLRKQEDGPDVLYFYTCALNDLLGYATFPWWYADKPLRDGVVNLDQSLPGGSVTNFNEGQTATHEIGHW
jgi:hypothetical protein